MEDVWGELSLFSLLPRSTSDAPVPSLRLAVHQSPSKAQPETEPTNGPTFGQTKFGSYLNFSGVHSSCSRDAKNKIQDDGAKNRRKIRLMKNRESAVRSRARKQAYIYELELEVARLLEENSMLKKQVNGASQKDDKSCEVIEEQDVKKKKKKVQLERTMTAPF